MAVQFSSPAGIVLAGVALTPNLLVTPAGALCAVSTTRTHAGVTQESQATVGKPCTVRRTGADFSTKVIAALAIAVGDLLYYDANGKVGKTSAGNTLIGIALTAASGNNSVFEAQLF
jgi:hypothetical protein